MDEEDQIAEEAKELRDISHRLFKELSEDHDPGLVHDILDHQFEKGLRAAAEELGIVL